MAWRRWAVTVVIGLGVAVVLDTAAVGCAAWASLCCRLSAARKLLTTLWYFCSVHTTQVYGSVNDLTLTTTKMQLNLLYNGKRSWKNKRHHRRNIGNVPNADEGFHLQVSKYVSSVRRVSFTSTCRLYVASVDDDSCYWSESRCGRRASVGAPSCCCCSGSVAWGTLCCRLSAVK